MSRMAAVPVQCKQRPDSEVVQAHYPGALSVAASVQYGQAARNRRSRRKGSLAPGGLRFFFFFEHVGITAHRKDWQLFRGEPRADDVQQGEPFGGHGPSQGDCSRAPSRTDAPSR